MSLFQIRCLLQVSKKLKFKKRPNISGIRVVNHLSKDAFEKYIFTVFILEQIM